MKIIGLMSGTSADAIDACLAEIADRRGGLSARVEAFVAVPYTRGERRRVLGVRTVEDVCRLNFELGELFARAALRVCDAAGVKPRDVDAIGSHGQTVWHVAEGPGRSTLQVGEPCVIAERTGITTVADFRTRDIAAGGCGAPLVPLVDFLLLRDPKIGRAVLNIGGIANITVLPAGCTLDQAVAFDTGPGNMVIDGLMELLSGGRKKCDCDGRMAARGSVIRPVLKSLLADRYYAAPPPKSTGREKFGRHFAERLLARCHGHRDANVVATATALTARTIADAIRRALPGPRKPEVIVSGGGVCNPTMMEMLRDELPGAWIRSAIDAGIEPSVKEALAFAILAYLTLHGRPGNVLGATGASHRVVLGKIVPAGSPVGPIIVPRRPRKTRRPRDS